MTSKKRNYRIPFIVIALFLIVALGFFVWHLRTLSKIKSENESSGIWSPAQSAEAEKEAAALTPENSQQFVHPTNKFSFRYPSNMKLTNFPNDNNDQGGEVVLVQSPDKGQGFQIIISPFDEQGDVLTEARIKQEIPDLTISNAEPVLLGDKGKGLAFLSNNDQFGGASREVWFIWNKNLYQISTYSYLDPLIKSVLATWTFQ